MFCTDTDNPERRHSEGEVLDEEWDEFVLCDALSDEDEIGNDVVAEFDVVLDVVEFSIPE